MHECEHLAGREDLERDQRLGGGRRLARIEARRARRPARASRHARAPQPRGRARPPFRRPGRLAPGSRRRSGRREARLRGRPRTPSARRPLRQARRAARGSAADCHRSPGGRRRRTLAPGATSSSDRTSSSVAGSVSGARRRTRDGRLGIECAEQLGGRSRLEAPGADREHRGEPLEPTREVGEESKRLDVRPVGVVDGDQKRAGLAHVRGQPVEPVQDGERGVERGRCRARAPGRRAGEVGFADRRHREVRRTGEKRARAPPRRRS